MYLCDLVINVLTLYLSSSERRGTQQCAESSEKEIEDYKPEFNHISLNENHISYERFFSPVDPCRHLTATAARDV